LLLRSALPLVAAAATLMPAAAQAAPISSAAQFPVRILAAHNAERAGAGLPPLAWDNGLGAAAAGYARHLAFTGRFEHSNRQARRGIGENLWKGSHGAFSVEAMVGGWASEKRWFRRGTFPYVSRTGSWEDVGHYTQMIWPTTQRIGCALASTPGIDYLVCRYGIAGNIDGRRIG
jgi:hypothetical protein